MPLQLCVSHLPRSSERLQQGRRGTAGVSVRGYQGASHFASRYLLLHRFLLEKSPQLPHVQSGPEVGAYSSLIASFTLQEQPKEGTRNQAYLLNLSVELKSFVIAAL